jgi:hypothetical protein
MQLPLKKLCNRLKHILLEIILNAPFGTRHFFGIPPSASGEKCLRKNACIFWDNDIGFAQIVYGN